MSSYGICNVTWVGRGAWARQVCWGQLANCKPTTKYCVVGAICQLLKFRMGIHLLAGLGAAMQFTQKRRMHPELGPDAVVFGTRFDGGSFGR